MMTTKELWIPGITRVDCSSRAVPIALQGAEYALHTWHSFETGAKGYELSAFVGARYLDSTNKLATFVWNPVLGGLVQMLPANVGARTLKADGLNGRHTNAYGMIHMQTEVIANAARPFTLDMTRAGYDDLMILLNFLRSWDIPDQWAQDRPPVFPGPGTVRGAPEQSGHTHHAAWWVNDHGDPGHIEDPWSFNEGDFIMTPTNYPGYPLGSAMRTNQFWYDLSKVLTSEGYKIYDDPSYVDRGYCVPKAGGHNHTLDPRSRHFDRRALDFGRDPAGQSISNFEKAYVDAKMRMIIDLYPAIGRVWNRGDNDHEDHAHLQDTVLLDNFFTNVPWAGVILYGTTGAVVKAWQENLKKVGMRVEADGIYRLETFWATKAWQSKRGLPEVDGIIGSGSQTEMQRNIAELVKPPPVVKPPVVTPPPVIVAPPTLTELEAIVRPYRASGINGYSSAVEVAKQAGAQYDPKKFYLAASGTSDAVAAASQPDGRLLLGRREGTSLPSHTRAFLRAMAPCKVVIVGGSDVFPTEQAYDALKSAQVVE